MELIENDTELKSDDNVAKMVEFLTAAERAKRCTDEDELVIMIDKYGLEREHMPSQLLQSRKVWEALVRNLKMEATIRNLGKITSMGLCDAGSWVERALVERLTDQNLLVKSRTHPFKVTPTIWKYQRCRSRTSSIP